MKKNELVEIIRSIVREEVKQTLPTLILEILSERTSSPSAARTVSSKSTSVSRETITEEKKPLKKFSNNPILNAVLNETQGGIPGENNVPMASTELTKSNTVVETLTSHIPKEVILENKEVQAVMGALTKDYRSLLKAADTIAKKSYRP